MIGEPVRFAQESRIRRLLVIRLVLFWVALALGAVALGGMLGGLGAAVLPQGGWPVVIALGVLAGLVILRETIGRDFPIPEIRWQVPPEWLRDPWVGAVTFGSIMGLGIFTRQSSALFHLYVLGCLCSGSWGRGALFGLVYGITYIAAFARGLVETRVGEPGLGVDWVARTWTQARWVGVIAAPLIVFVPLAWASPDPPTEPRWADLMLQAIPSEVSSIARAAVALLFLAAAAAKLARPAATSAALGVLRIPNRYRTTVTRLLALVEVAVAASLLLVDSRTALLAPAVMLLVFSVFLGHLAYRGAAVACGCLGDLGSESSWLGLSRNLCLLALLALAASGDPGGTTAWSVLGGAQVAVLLIVVTEGLYVVRRLHTLEVAYRD